MLVMMITEDRKTRRRPEDLPALGKRTQKGTEVGWSEPSDLVFNLDQFGPWSQ